MAGVCATCSQLLLGSTHCAGCGKAILLGEASIHVLGTTAHVHAKGKCLDAFDVRIRHVKAGRAEWIETLS